jgi:hypothetical protein
MFASVYNYRSQDAKIIGPRQWGCNTSKEDIKRCIGVQYSRTKEARRNQWRNPRCGLSASAWWRTGQCCPGVHRTVRWSTGQSAQRGHRQALSGCSTDLSGGAPDSRHRTVRCAPDKRQRSTPTGANGRLTWRAPDTAQWLSGGAPDCPVHPTTESRCFLSNG